MSNRTGQQGEYAFGDIIMRRFDRNTDYFDPRSLGEKKPTTDYYIELIGCREFTPYFFVQVKATRRGGNNIPVNLSHDDIRKIRSYPGPIYLVGIHLTAQTATGYLLAVDRHTRGRISSIPKTFPINAENTAILYREVQAYWRKSHDRRKIKKSVFSR